MAERLYAYNPNLKLIILFRDPVERAFSAWTMYHHHFKTGRNNYLHDPRSFGVAVSEEIDKLETESYTDNRISFVKRGLYQRQIKKYLTYFKKDQILIIESNALLKRSAETLKRIQRFIQVPYEKLDFKISNESRVSEKDKYVEGINSLRVLYKPYNEKLYALIDKRFDWDRKF